MSKGKILRKVLAALSLMLSAAKTIEKMGRPSKPGNKNKTESLAGGLPIGSPFFTSVNVSDVKNHKKRR